jgi:hypothetical protein
MEDLLEAFSEYITIGKPNLLQYKAWLDFFLFS